MAIAGTPPKTGIPERQYAPQRREVDRRIRFMSSIFTEPLVLLVAGRSRNCWINFSLMLSSPKEPSGAHRLLFRIPLVHGAGNQLEIQAVLKGFRQARR